MILCVSLSPCLEVNVEVDCLSVGKTNKVISRRNFFTGKTLNVAVGLSHLGASALATGFMYEENGRLFEQELHKEGVTYKFIWNSGKVREVYKFIDRRSMLTEVVDEASPVDAGNEEKLVALVGELSKKCEAVVICGDLGSVKDGEFVGRILSAVPEKCKKIVDLDGDLLIKTVKICGVDLVKPNLTELERALKIKISDKNGLVKACGRLVELGAKKVLVSLGKNGAVLCDGNKSLYCKSVNVAMNSTAGAGDAMVAAATKAVAEGRSEEEILCYGVAAGTAAVTQPDTISFRSDKFAEILPTLKVKEI